MGKQQKPIKHTNQNWKQNAEKMAKQTLNFLASMSAL